MSTSQKYIAGEGSTFGAGQSFAFDTAASGSLEFTIDDSDVLKFNDIALLRFFASGT